MATVGRSTGMAQGDLLHLGLQVVHMVVAGSWAIQATLASETSARAAIQMAKWGDLAK